MNKAFALLALLFASPLIAEEARLVGSSALKLFPDATSQTVTTLSQGTIVNVLQTSEDWVMIESFSGGVGYKGWVTANALQNVPPTASPAPSLLSPQPPRGSLQPRASHESLLSLAFNPVTLIFPWLELQLGIHFAPRFRLNLTPQLMWWAWGDPAKSVVYGGTVSGTFFFEQWQGWYIEPGYVHLRTSSNEGGYAHGPQVIGGYEHTFRDNRTFINFGIGFWIATFNETDNNNDDEIFEFDTTIPLPTGNVLLGFRF